MTQAATNIAHESEAQRQYVRIHLPAKVSMNGTAYPLRDLSSGGVAILDVVGTYERGQVVSLEIALPFQNFTLDIQLEAQVQNFDSAAKTIGARFINLTKQQISLLNHVITSYIAGDVVDSGNLLNVVARDNFVKVRKQDGPAAAAPEIKRQILPLALIILLGAIGLYIIGSNVYGALFVVKSNDGYVDGDITQVTVPSDGILSLTYDQNAPSVKAGDIIASISGTNGGNVNLYSPCECFVIEANGRNGQHVTSGQSIITLTPVDVKPTVMVRMESHGAQRLRMDSTPTISIVGDAVERTGRIVSIKSSLANKVSVNTVTPEGQPSFSYITIQPDQDIPAELIGRPTQVNFRIN